jgi:hypothetical protein
MTAKYVVERLLRVNINAARRSRQSVRDLGIAAYLARASALKTNPTSRDIRV